MKYELMGSREAPVILMFPGSFGSARMMQGYTDLLKERYCVIAVTLDGCDGGGGDYTSKDEVTDKVLKKVKELGIRGRIMPTFLIEAAVLCVLFHLVIWLQTRKEPAERVYSYPPAIVE